jgi:DNA-binding NarL/FixJ family response regulator
MGGRKHPCAHPHQPARAGELVSQAERAVVAHVCAGRSNKEIARCLGLSEAAVKHHVSACLRKLGLRSRYRLMAALR